MCSEDTLQAILAQLHGRMRVLLGPSMRESILFGSYARREAEEGSDIDVLFLSDMGRDEIAALTWQIGKIAGDLLLSYGVLVSPIVENRQFFMPTKNRCPSFAM